MEKMLKASNRENLTKKDILKMEKKLEKAQMQAGRLAMIREQRERKDAEREAREKQEAVRKELEAEEEAEREVKREAKRKLEEAEY